MVGSITIGMELCHCSECACHFCIPENMFTCRARDGSAISCPGCGYQLIFAEDKKLAEDRKPDQDIERRRELILAIHRAEQAEAKAAEAVVARTGEPPPVIVEPQPKKKRAK